MSPFASEKIVDIVIALNKKGVESQHIAKVVKAVSDCTDTVDQVISLITPDSRAAKEYQSAILSVLAK